ncbi:MAG TPA: ATP-grasp domain-containing protein [Methanosarcinales archaeon]|nr:ATP-grasp domain-containing protein [Methanosarcinales archaeon]
MKILVIGYSTRYIVCSAKRAGYKVFSLDCFGDVDLRQCAYSSFLFEDPISADIESIIRDYIMDYGIDVIVLGSGFERVKPPRGCRVLNNDFEIMKKVTNKEWLMKKLDFLGIPHPITYNDLTEINNYPVLIKPRYGGGGMYNTLIYNKEDQRVINKDVIIQDYITGTPASVSVISTKDDAVAIASNEQLIGAPKYQFAYAGNITPLDIKQKDLQKHIQETAVQLISELKLIGYNGVDFIINKEGFFVIEVNPRLTGSLDTIELATDMNVFDMHVRAFNGELRPSTKIKRYAAKKIIYATKDLIINTDFTKFAKPKSAYLVDISPIGSAIKGGDPITTVLGTGANRREVMQTIRKLELGIKKELVIKR